MQVLPVSAVQQPSTLISSEPTPTTTVLVPTKLTTSATPSKTHPITIPLKCLKSVGTGGLKTLKWLLLNFHNILIYGVLLPGIAGAYTPGAWKAVNSALQSDLLGYVPKPANTINISENECGYPYDNFVQNFDGFHQIQTAINRANINPFSLDKNNNGIFLDTKEEIQELILKLQEARSNATDSSDLELYSKATNLLSDINILSQLIWGANGPNPDNISQRGEPTCQSMSALRGLFLTPEHTQAAKGLIKVTGYSLGQNPYIDTTVRINGEDVPVPFSELTISMSPIEYSPSQSNDGSLFTAILSRAVKIKSPDKIPNFWPSTSPILLTSQNYSTVGIMAFSDSELDELLSQAPQTLITVASVSKIGGLQEALEDRQKNWVTPLHSEEKATQFLGSVSNRMQDILASTTTPAKPENTPPLLAASQGTNSSLPQTQSGTTTSSFPPSSPSPQTLMPTYIQTAKDVMEGHMYVVENYDSKTGTLIISDTHGVKIKLTREEIRERLFAIVLPDDSFNFFSSKSLGAYGLVLSLGLAYCLGKRGVKLLLFPKKKTLLQN